jgi:hypothetical protein
MEQPMTIAVDLRDDIQARLQQKARAAGVDMPTYAARILEVEAMRVPLEEVLRPVREAFAASGMSGDELAERLEKEKHEAREARNGTRFSE